MYLWNSKTEKETDHILHVRFIKNTTHLSNSCRAEFFVSVSDIPFRLKTHHISILDLSRRMNWTSVSVFRFGIRFVVRFYLRFRHVCFISRDLLREICTAHIYTDKSTEIKAKSRLGRPNLLHFWNIFSSHNLKRYEYSKGIRKYFSLLINQNE